MSGKVEFSPDMLTLSKMKKDIEDDDLEIDEWMNYWIILIMIIKDTIIYILILIFIYLFIFYYIWTI